MPNIYAGSIFIEIFKVICVKNVFTSVSLSIGSYHLNKEQ